MSLGVYILLCSNQRYYIGSTNDLSRRLAEHQSGRSKYIKHLLPVSLIFFQEFTSLATARKIEYRLKKLKNKRLIEKIIHDQRISDRYLF